MNLAKGAHYSNNKKNLTKKHLGMENIDAPARVILHNGFFFFASAWTNTPASALAMPVTSLRLETRFLVVYFVCKFFLALQAVRDKTVHVPACLRARVEVRKLLKGK